MSIKYFESYIRFRLRREMNIFYDTSVWKYENAHSYKFVKFSGYAVCIKLIMRKEI